MKNFFKARFLCLIIALFVLSSCVETVVTGFFATGYIGARNKSFKDTRSDIAIASRLAIKYFENGLKKVGSSVDITVNEGRVLLTGIVSDRKKIDLAVRLAWQDDRVKEVIDEIMYIDRNHLSAKDFSKSLNDYYITSKVEGILLASNNVSFVNYKVNTIRGHVFLIGRVKDDVDLKIALTRIAKIRGVVKVINHVKVGSK